MFTDAANAGTVANLPTQASALKAVEALRIDANQQTPRTDGRPSTVAELIEHYRLKELTENDQGRKAHSTRAGYQCYLNGWIFPRWGNHRLQQVKSVAVEEWLGSIKRARGTKAKIRNIMSALFSHAMRYEWTDKNPIKLVRQSAKRERIPAVLELHELQALLGQLAVRERTLVLLDAATGLRVSELLALRWDDIDFENLEIRVTESIWHQVLGVCKTEASAKPVPMDSYMAEDLLRWRKACAYPMEGDWVFASPRMKGRQPYWPDNLMKRYIKPAAKKVGIHKNIRWHPFRHSFGTILKANGEDVKTVQELLRHANSRITLDAAAWNAPSAPATTSSCFRTFGGKLDCCTDPTCYQSKVAAHVAKAIAAKPNLVQISTAYGQQKEGSTTLPRNKYTEIRAKKPNGMDETKRPEFKVCKFTTEAIVTDGAEVGTLRKVCANPTCPIHHPQKRQNGRDEERWKAEQEKRRREQAVAHATGIRVLAAIGAAVPVRLMKRDLAFVVERLVSLMGEPQIATLARQHGIRQKRDDGGKAKMFVAYLRRTNEGTLSRLIVELTILLLAARANGGNVLRDAANLYKVDTDAISRKVKQELDIKASVNKRPKPAPKARTAA